MTLLEWNATKGRLNKECSAAYRSGDLVAHAAALARRDAHMALRSQIEAQTVRTKQDNRTRDAALKAKARPKAKPKLDWAAIERREAEVAALERLMTHKTGVNAGAPA